MAVAMQREVMISNYAGDSPLRIVWIALQQLGELCWRSLTNGRALVKTSPYVAVIAYCVYFVMQNGGISMGDHSAHSPVFHAMQIFYFSAIFCLFQPLLCVRTIIDFRYRRSQMFCFFVATLVTLYCIRNYT